MDVITIILIIVACIVLGLGFAVVLNSKEKLNHFYFLNIITILCWVITMMFYRLSSDETILLWTKLLYVAASIIASNFLYFTYVFPRYEKVPLKTRLTIIVPNFILIILCLIGNTIITGAKVNLNGENFIHWGFLYPLYVIYILFYFNLAFYLLAKKIIASVNEIEKMQLAFVLLGYMLSGFISFITNLILPSFGIFTLNWVGQVSTILMAISATYAIIKHRLFNLKAIIIELFIFIIWIIILIRLLISYNPSDLIINGVTFLLTIFVGILLIKGISKEVSQREKIQSLANDLKSLNATLAQKVAEQTKDVRAAYELEKVARADLEKLNESKDQFIIITQHNLRTPITNILWRLETLLSGELGTLTPEITQIIQDTKTSTDRLKRIIEDFLNLTAMKTGASVLNISRASLKDIMIENIAELKNEIERMNIRVTYPTDEASWPTIAVDVGKMREVLLIILENAVRYNNKNGTITIKTSTEQNEFILTIENTGIGIKPEEKEAIASALFYRGEYARSTYPTGMGVGLTVARAILKAHGGELTVESDGEGCGARVIIKYKK